MKTFYVIVGAVALAGLSCAVAPDPGEFTVVPRDSGSNVGLGGDGGGIVDPGGEGGLAADSGSVPDPVFGFDKFGSGSASPRASGVAAHGTNGPNPAALSGQDCLSCHRANGAASGKPFLFAGSIFVDKAGATRQGAKMQVRIVGPDGNKVGSDAYTDEDGNFWALAGATIPGMSKVGVRSATKIEDMSGTIGPGNVSCNSMGCHAAGKVIYLQ